MCDLNFKSIRATQPNPLHLFCTRGIPYSKKNIRIIDCRYDIKTKRRINPTVVVHPVGLVLIRMGCIVYLPSPRTLRTQQATPPCLVCKLIIAQLKLSHPVCPVPHKALRSRSSPAPVLFLLSSHIWLSVLQVLYLVLEHNARLVCNTDSGATGNIEEGQTCIVLSNWCVYAHFVVSWSCYNKDTTICTTIGLIITDVV